MLNRTVGMSGLDTLEMERRGIGPMARKTKGQSLNCTASLRVYCRNNVVLRHGAAGYTLACTIRPRSRNNSLWQQRGVPALVEDDPEP